MTIEFKDGDAMRSSVIHKKELHFSTARLMAKYVMPERIVKRLEVLEVECDCGE